MKTKAARPGTEVLPFEIEAFNETVTSESNMALSAALQTPTPAA